jgi:death-on-curing protein
VIFLSPREVVEIHEFVIDDHELQGLARDKSIDAIIARIDNRIAYGMIRDEFELAACYACYLSVGHAFHDANERTAFATMDTCLALNGITLDYKAAEIGSLIVKAAQGIVDELELAEWLRVQAQ